MNDSFVDLIAQTHFEASKDCVASLVLLTTDIDLAKVASKYLSKVFVINTVRGQYACSGYYKDKYVSIVTTGMGMFPTYMYSKILFAYYDVDKIVKCDTCFGLNKNLKVGQNVVVDKVKISKHLAIETDSKTCYRASKKLLDKVKKLSPLKEVSDLCILRFYDPTKSSNIKNIDVIEIESMSLYKEAELYNKQAVSILKVSEILQNKQLPMTSSERSFLMEDTIVICLDLLVS